MDEDASTSDDLYDKNINDFDGKDDSIDGKILTVDDHDSSDDDVKVTTNGSSECCPLERQKG